MSATLQPLRCQMCALAPKTGATPCTFRHLLADPGAVLIDQGSAPSRVVYLRRGYVVLSSSPDGGRSLSCAVRGPDTMLGLEGVLGRSMPYEVRALTDAALCFLEVDSFKAWIGPLDSPLGAALRFSLEESMRRAGERQSIEGSALRRVARFLAEAAREGEGRNLPDIPLAVLAKSLAMRPETLSRALSALRALGALAGGREIRVADAEKLRLAGA